MTQLRSRNLPNTQVTETAVEELRNARPSLARGIFLEVGANQSAEHAVASRVEEPPAHQLCSSTSPRVLSDHRTDRSIFRLGGVDALLEEERQIRLRLSEFELMAIVELHVRFAVGQVADWAMGPHKLDDDVPHAWVRLVVGESFRPYADLAATVASQHQPVLNECDEEAQTNGTNGEAAERNVIRADTV